jgi:hypothetical protein
MTKTAVTQHGHHMSVKCVETIGTISGRARVQTTFVSMKRNAAYRCDRRCSPTMVVDNLVVDVVGK